MLLFVVLTVILCASVCNADNIVEKDGHDVKTTGAGQTSIIIPELLKFSMPKDCMGQLKMCYESESMTCNGATCNNLDDRCPRGSCFINFGIVSTFTDLLKMKNELGSIVGTFISSPKKYCPLKKSAQQNFKITDMPQCHVIIIGASLPAAEPKEEIKENDEFDDGTEVSATTVKEGIARWVYPVSIVSSIIVLVGIALCAFGLYKFCKNKATANAPELKKLPSPPKTVVTVSPHPNPTSPMASPAVSPITTPRPTTPPVVPKAESTVVAPTRMKADNDLPKVAPEVKNEVKREERPKPKARPASIHTTITTCETTEDYGIIQLIEEHAESLNRWGQLHFKGVHPIEVGSRRHPYLQVIYKKCRSTHRRQIQQYELEYFASDVSSAFQEAKWRLKDTRQILCRHGAVYEHGRWKSFKEATYDYLAKPSTPGFVLAYAFASEYGGDITMKIDNVKTRRTLRKLSAPALLTVFLREDQRNAFRIEISVTSCVEIYFT